MNDSVESSDRGPIDFFFFGLAGFGILLSVVGIVLVSVDVAVLGLFTIAVGLLFFLIRNQSRRSTPDAGKR